MASKSASTGPSQHGFTTADAYSHSDSDALPIRLVDPSQLFNESPYSHMIIDVRSRQQHEAQNIRCSMSLPSEDKAKQDCIKDFLNRVIVDGMSPERTNLVVFYGDSDDAETYTFVEWIRQRLIHLQRTLNAPALAATSHTYYVVDDDPDRTRDGYVQRAFRHLVQGLQRNCKELWVIRGGFEAFQQRFPMLCDASIPFQQVSMLPTEITPLLYLGSRALTMDADTMSLFGISAVISHVKKKPPTILGLFRRDVDDVIGVDTLRCDVENTAGQDMRPCFAACNQFIDEAVAKGKRILIFVHGRSISAAIAAAWLLHRDPSLSVCEAVVRIKSCQRRIDESLMFLDQLQDMFGGGGRYVQPSESRSMLTDGRRTQPWSL